MKEKKYILILLLVFFSQIVAWKVFIPGQYWNEPVDQWAQIIFSHKYHHEEVEAECADCHVTAEESMLSSDFLLPKMETCGDCHDEIDDGECGFCHVDPEIQVPFAKVERELVFNHNLHVEADLKCTKCHAGIESSEAPSNANLPTMALCQTCHDGFQQDNTCETCHSQLEMLTPANHLQPDWGRQHKRVVISGQHENDCLSCHSDNSCQECHSAAQVMTTAEQLQRPLMEARPMQFSRTLLTSQKVHDNNYLFWHAIDHKAKTTDCLTCHNKQTFCNECHTSDQDAGFSSPIPAGHSQLDFIRIGVGSGGGLHAKQAKQDIESCMSCHDLEGRDPACLLCHTDRTPGIGNDPKTHTARFMRTDRGDYHDNLEASCYNCHVDTQTAGVGFCGYCHGVK
ncbi:MAG: hypothetical protein DWQ05_20110 [Calditrichaeota bacterium]|nr:MAG: hypothetical protein DWQ05_20110 [Calditrichota bacterium]